MRFGAIVHVLGLVIIFIGLALLPSAGFAWFDGESTRFIWLAYACGVVVLGFGLNRLISLKSELSYREGFCVVTFGWLSMAVLGAVPYLFSGVFTDVVFAFFESASGFTTTGATVITDIEILPRSILFWRSLTHWLGGMGVIVLSVCILPLLGVGGMQLFRAEAPGPVTDKLTPRIASTAKILWWIYLLFTVVQATLLYFCGMSIFDSVCHSFSTLATGGFSTKNASIISYNNVYVEIVTTVFMLIAGINFALHYRFLKGDLRAHLQNSEFRFYGVILVLALLVVVFDVWGSFYISFLDALRFAGFQVASISTSTGFITADFNQWPALSKVVLLSLMIMGASAGSTGGGFKAIRVLVIFKYGFRELRRLLYPKAVLQIKLKGMAIPKETVHGVLRLICVLDPRNIFGNNDDG